jgi:hypothetical protein
MTYIQNSMSLSNPSSSLTKSHSLEVLSSKPIIYSHIHYFFVHAWTSKILVFRVSGRRARKPFYTPMFMWNHFLLFAVNQNAPELDTEK